MRRTMIAVLLLVWAMPAHAAEQLIPLAEGNKWVYSVKEDGVMSFESEAGTKSSKTSSLGTVTEIIRLAPHEGPNGADAFLREIATDMKAGLNTQARQSASEELLLATENGIEMIGSRTSGLAGALSGEWQSYAPPLLLYRADAKQGTSWEVGIMREGDIRVQLDASVPRTQDVKVPAGLFKDCLEVCIGGRRVTGVMTLGKLRIPIKQGMQLTMVWIAKGVGVVKEDSLMQITIDLPGSEGGSPIAATTTKRKIKELQPGYKVK